MVIKPNYICSHKHVYMLIKQNVFTEFSDCTEVWDS